jgi:hypothetical protein
MGVTYSLHLIEPAKFARVVDELRSHPFSNVPDVEAYIDHYQLANAQDRSLLIDEFSRLLENPDDTLSPSVYGDLLRAVVTEREWYLDKSLNHYALERPLKTFPALKPLRFLVSFDGWDSEPPEELFCESGLYGLWSASFLAPTIEILDRFSTEKSAREYADTIEWSWFDRFFRRPRHSQKALEAWLDGWTFWEDIGSAIKETVDRRWALGCAMCP